MTYEYFNSLNNGSIYKADLACCESYNIKEWNVKEYFKDAVGNVMICAPTNSGKSILVADVLNKIGKNYENIYLMSGTCDYQTSYDIIPKKNTINHFSEEFLQDLWESCSKNKVMKHNVVVIDDLIHCKNFQRSEMLKRIAISGRHVGISCFILSQAFTSVPLTIRSNVRLAICFDLDSLKEKQKFTSSYIGCAKNQRVAMMVYDKICKERYQCIVLELNKVGAKLEDKLFKYTAQIKKIKEKVKSEVIPKMDMSTSTQIDTGVQMIIPIKSRKKKIDTVGIF